MKCITFYIYSTILLIVCQLEKNEFVIENIIETVLQKLKTFCWNVCDCWHSHFRQQVSQEALFLLLFIRLTSTPSVSTDLNYYYRLLS